MMVFRIWSTKSNRDSADDMLLQKHTETGPRKRAMPWCHGMLYFHPAVLCFVYLRIIQFGMNMDESCHVALVGTMFQTHQKKPNFKTDRVPLLSSNTKVFIAFHGEFLSSAETSFKEWVYHNHPPKDDTQKRSYEKICTRPDWSISIFLWTAGWPSAVSALFLAPASFASSNFGMPVNRVTRLVLAWHFRIWRYQWNMTFEWWKIMPSAFLFWLKHV